jgi:hypothetical protein
MKRMWLVLALTAVSLYSSTAWAEWIYPGPRRAYYAAPVVVVRPRPYVWAAPVYYAPPVYAAPVYAPPVYAPPMYSTAYASPSVYAAAPIYSPAPVYVAPAYAAPVVTPRRVYYPGEPIRNAVKFVVP